DGPLGAAVPEELGAGPVEGAGPGERRERTPGRAVERGLETQRASREAWSDLDPTDVTGPTEVEGDRHRGTAERPGDPLGAAVAIDRALGELGILAGGDVPAAFVEAVRGRRGHDDEEGIGTGLALAHSHGLTDEGGLH